MTGRSDTVDSVEGSSGDFVYHVALQREWEEARNSGEYRRSTRGKSLGEVGFIHCSFADQVRQTAARLYPNDDVIVLAIDPSTAGL